MPSLTPLRSALRAPAATRLSPLLGARYFQTSQVSRMAYKDDQDRESLKPKAHEYTQTGTDDQVAANSDAAFNPDKTRPETEKKAADSSLDGSPADKGVASGGQNENPDKPKKAESKSSGGGSPKKGGKVNPEAPGRAGKK